MPSLAINPYLDEAFTVTGAIAGLIDSVNTQVYKNDVITFVHSEMAKEFDVHAALLAAAAPSNFGHVFEWRMTGNLAGKLWRHRLVGSVGDRTASFEWLASKTPILTPEERKNKPNDLMSTVPDKEIAKLSKRRYFFYWKAPMMEFNMETTIAPRWSKALFIPTGVPPKHYMIHKGSIRKTAGGRSTSGSFTSLWAEWWGTQADAIFNNRLRRIIEMDLANAVESGMRIKKSVGRTTVAIGTIASAAEAREAGKAMAEAFIFGKAKSYRAAAAYLEDYG
jgi:hypothetical protein